VAHAIEGCGLRKSFARKRSIREIGISPFARAERLRALQGVDLQVRPGEIFGLLGPNGAGKTTLLKIFACLILPDEGQALVDGTDTTNENAVKRKIGLVNSDERSFYWRISGRENMRFFARLHDVERGRTESRINELLERVDMLGAADRPFSDYSSGMKQRVAIARALLHDPPIVLMDEPTRSLDPSSALAVRAFIHDELRRRDGKTIVIASHNLHEIEDLADRIAILVGGKIRHVGTVSDNTRLGVDEQRFALEVAACSTPLAGPIRIDSDRTEDGVRKVELALVADGTLDELLRALIRDGFVIRACDRIESDLEQAFARLVEGSTGTER
jgi:ABC-2 type transport system ATP-binding protein